MWAKLAHEYQERLTMLRLTLEKDLTDKDTAKVRGRIAEVRRLLALPKEIDVVEVHSGEY